MARVIDFKAKKKSWIRRHPIWSLVILLVALNLLFLGAILPEDEKENKPSDLKTTSQNIPNQVQETNSLFSCIKSIAEAECQKEGLIYTDYSSSVGFITCTDDGVYSMNDIGDNTRYLQVYAPLRIFKIKCGMYNTSTNTQLKCQEDFFESKCQGEDLIYTDWSPSVGFITCTDDGIYTFKEIGDESKYKQIYVTSEFVDSRCP
ncbi:Uncharacterised protein [uncultured archaeon]|nr:Uncharacterised protein [uncultured archaeon]